MATKIDPGTNGKATEPAEDAGRAAAVGNAVAGAAGTVRGAAGEAVAKLPEFTATTRGALEDANRQMRGGSDEMLTIGSVLSFGFAAGLLIGGASRLLVAVAMIPAAMMGLTLLDRSSRSRQSRKVQGS